MTLTAQELKEKIAKVETDLIKLSEQGGNIHAVSTLSSYKEYLEDELQLAEQSNINNIRLVRVENNLQKPK
jgi:hypothetical protein